VNGLTVVGGGGGSLGRALVTLMAGQGATVVAVGRPGFAEAPTPEPWPSHSVIRLGADLADAAAVAGLWERIDAIGEVETMVHVVGGFQAGTITDTSFAAYRQNLQLNLDSAWLSCREAAPRLATRGSGAIVNVSSRAAIGGGAQSAAYAVAKAGVVRLTEVLAAELAPHRVRVNAVLPSVIDTAANRRNLSASASLAVAPEAIAKVIAFLVGPDGWPISGAAIPVYGWA
jgi:NAD(P)-dependent dehydrogenase (short-subunit alcohol dehydrogenase family)